MSLDQGTLSIYGRVAYVAQGTWVMSGSLRENIVFMSQYDYTRYQEVVNMCCLEEDFKFLPGGDRFLVGEFGRNLSGGQRARIALARALYSQADILLLEDPLSAVDGKIRGFLFDTIKALGVTVVLVTLHTSFVPHVDNVILIEKNRVTWCGPTADFLSSSGFRDSVLHEKWLDETKAPEVLGIAERHAPVGPDGDASQRDTGHEFELVEEERAKGAVKLHVFSFYVEKTGGTFQAICVVFLMACLTVAKVMGNYWFVWWIADELGLEQDRYLSGYLGLTLGQTIFTSESGINKKDSVLAHLPSNARDLALLALGLVYASMRASRSIHATVIQKILSAPISYFQRHPPRRILNRLSSDIESWDTRIINAIDTAIGCSTNLLASLCLILVSSPIVVAAIVPYILVTGYYQSRFRVCSREVQHSCSILLPPVTTILSEALKSPISVKAYGAVHFMVEKHGAALDQLMATNLVRKSLDT